MPVISDIAIRIRAITDPFTRGLARARQKVKGFAGSIGRFFGPVGGIFVRLGATILALINPINIVKTALAGLAIAFGLITAASIVFIKKQFDMIDEVKKTSRALGVQIEFLEGMKLAGSQLGVSNEKIIKSLKKFSRTMGEAALNTGAGATVFRIWGKDVSKFAGLKVEDSFAAISAELKKIKDPTQQAAIAFQFFGRNGIEMLNIINAGKGSIEDFMKESIRLKGAFSEVDVTTLEAANDALDKTKISMGGLFKEMSFIIAPFIKFFADKMTNVFINLRQQLEGARGSIINGIIKALKFGAIVVIAFGRVFAILAKGIESFFGLDGPNAIGHFEKSLLGLIGNFAFFADKMSKSKGTIGDDFKDIGLLMGIALSTPFEVAFKNMQEFIATSIQGFILLGSAGARIFEVMSKAGKSGNFSNIGKDLKGVFERFKVEREQAKKSFGKFLVLEDVLTGKIDEAAKKTKDKLGGAITVGIKEGFKNSKGEREKFVREFISSVQTSGNDFESSLEKFLDDLKNIKMPDGFGDDIQDAVKNVKLSPKLALRGSQEAARLLAGKQGTEEKIVNNTKDTAKNTKKMANILERISLGNPANIADSVDVFDPALMATGG